MHAFQYQDLSIALLATLFPTRFAILQSSAADACHPCPCSRSILTCGLNLVIQSHFALALSLQYALALPENILDEALPTAWLLLRQNLLAFLQLTSQDRPFGSLLTAAPASSPLTLSSLPEFATDNPDRDVCRADRQVARHYISPSAFYSASMHFSQDLVSFFSRSSCYHSTTNLHEITTLSNLHQNTAYLNYERPGDHLWKRHAVVVYRFQEDLSYSQISTKLNIDRKATASLVQRSTARSRSPISTTFKRQL
jgi:hypothetical protein